jgi:hypothetical protein
MLRLLTRRTVGAVESLLAREARAPLRVLDVGQHAAATVRDDEEARVLGPAAVDPAPAFVVLVDIIVEHPAGVGVPAIHRATASHACECSAKGPPMHGVAALKGLKPPLV